MYSHLLFSLNSFLPNNVYSSCKSWEKSIDAGIYVSQTILYNMSCLHVNLTRSACSFSLSKIDWLEFLKHQILIILMFSFSINVHLFLGKLLMHTYLSLFPLVDVVYAHGSNIKFFTTRYCLNAHLCFYPHVKYSSVLIK